MRTIWLASYPKSGNTWFRVLLANLMAQAGKPADINDLPAGNSLASAYAALGRLTLLDPGLLTHDEIDCLRPHIYEGLAQSANVGKGDEEDDDDGARSAALGVRFVKTHDAYIKTAWGEPLLAGRRGADGAILIVRDPRDVGPSFAHHKASDMDKTSDLDKAIAFMGNRGAALAGKPNRMGRQFRQRLLTWSDHIASWLDQSDIPVHLVRYEDMKADTAGTLSRALAFAQHQASAEDIERAVRLSDFAQLQAQERAKGFREGPRPQSDGQFFRRGIVGAWRDELTADQVARLERDHGPMMRRLGYELVSSPELAQAG